MERWIVRAEQIDSKTAEEVSLMADSATTALHFAGVSPVSYDRDLMWIVRVRKGGTRKFVATVTVSGGDASEAFRTAEQMLKG